MMSLKALMLLLDLAGTFVFAISGAVAGVRALGHVAHLPVSISASVAAALCFGLRLMAIYYGWRLPTAAAGDSHGTNGR